VTMEHDCRKDLAVLPCDRRIVCTVRGQGPWLAHGGKCGRQVARCAAGKPGMHPDCSVEIRIGHRHDGGRRSAGREPSDIDASRVDRVVAHDLAGDACDQGGLALAALLVAWTEPVPTL